jgi:CheY-like chemotaxis protein
VTAAGSPESVAQQDPDIHNQEDVMKTQMLNHAAHHRVLVVDDNDASARTLGWMFEALDAEVQVAHSGEEALQQANAFRPDLILMDIGMPGMDGYEACRLLRQQPTLNGTLIAAQTGWGQPEDRRRAREAGFDQHLVKPVMIEHLQGLLEDLEARQVS